MAAEEPRFNAVLFVTNLAPNVDEVFLKGLFSAYGETIAVSLHHDDVNDGGTSQPVPPSSTPPTLYALVSYHHQDDADCAIAALHLRYCTLPRLPLVVVYHASSPKISPYGRNVGRALVAALEQGKAYHEIAPVALDAFDPSVDRAVVAPPPQVLRPVQTAPMATAVGNGYGRNGGSMMPMAAAVGSYSVTGDHEPSWSRPQ